MYDHEYRQPGYSLSLRSLTFLDEYKLVMTDKIKWLRLEIVLAGELQVKDTNGKVIHLLPGQYHLTDTPVFQTQFHKDQGCTYFAAYYSPDFLAGLGLPTAAGPVSPRPLPKAMQEMVDELLENPFDEEWRPFYYGKLYKRVIVHARISTSFRLARRTDR